jgi:hypothetical protein
MPRGSIISRLTGSGAAAALLALLIRPFSRGSDPLVWPLLALVVVAALAGAAILLLTGADILLHPRRGKRIGPIRVFDIVAGAALLAFGLIQLHSLAGRLPA